MERKTNGISRRYSLEIELDENTVVYEIESPPGGVAITSEMQAASRAVRRPKVIITDQPEEPVASSHAE